MNIGDVDMRNLFVITLGTMSALMLMGFASSADAADGAALYQQKTCVSCHGKDAKSPLIASYPKLAGQNADYIFEQLKDIKSGARSNGQSAAMKGILTMVSEKEMRTIADWLATL